MKSTVTFMQYFFEDMSVDTALGGGGVFSPVGNINSSDNIYAPGDMRVPKLLKKGVQTRFGTIGSTTKKRKKRKKRKVNRK